MNGDQSCSRGSVPGGWRPPSSLLLPGGTLPPGAEAQAAGSLARALSCDLPGRFSGTCSSSLSLTWLASTTQHERPSPPVLSPWSARSTRSDFHFRLCRPLHTREGPFSSLPGSTSPHFPSASLVLGHLLQVQNQPHPRPRVGSCLFARPYRW